MPNKLAVMVCLGDYYGEYTDLPSLRFAYKNAYDFNDKLNLDGWVTFPPIPNEIATKDYCLKFLKEKIDLLQHDDDWLLFYYVGHAEQFTSGNPMDDYPVYMVTSLLNTGYSSDNPNSYFEDTDYDDILKLFKSKAPNGHFITVLDCCYAFGLINNYSIETDFHTVFAASSARYKAAYTDNSFFFKSFKQAWNANSFLQIKNAVELSMRNDYNTYSYANFCQIQIATNFQNDTF